MGQNLNPILGNASLDACGEKGKKKREYLLDVFIDHTYLLPLIFVTKHPSCSFNIQECSKKKTENILDASLKTKFWWKINNLF